MIFTGKNLAMVRRGIDAVAADIRNMIVTCPDEDLYAEDLAELRAELAEYEKMLDRIDVTTKKET